MITIRHAKQERGMALIFAMMAIIVILGALGLVMIYVQTAKQGTDAAYDNIVLEEAAKAGIDLAVERLWNQYIVSNGNTTGNMASYRYFLDNILELPNTEDFNANGIQDEHLGEEDLNGRNGWEPWPDSYEPLGWPLLEEPFEYRDPDTNRLLATIDNVYLVRTDRRFGTGTSVTVRAVAELNGREKIATQRITIGGEDQGWGQFAVMANNISCILCHANIRSLDLDMNTDPDLYNTFDRIKVASLESLLVRPGSGSNSKIAGTLYTRGRVYRPNGSPYTASQLANTNFNAWHFDTTNGKLSQNNQGEKHVTSLVNGQTNADGQLIPFANLYMDYPEDPELMTDGPVPTDFPSPFPDENGNRYVDDEEFETIVNASHGSIHFELDESEAVGSVTAGVAYGVPHGEVYLADNLPTSSNASAVNSLASGSYDGNLILVGTEYDPIVINNNVAVNGDLVIKGPIRGRGRLLVRGNTYIAGDVTYANASDNPADFGVAEDGNENLFAIITGGSVLMGDYLTVRGVNHSARENEKYPRWQEYSIHMRDAHRSNNVTVGGVTETLEWGYFDPYSVDAGEIVPGRPGQQFSFTTSELKLFNNMELKKALDDPSYTPRFYGLRESQPHNIYVYDPDDEHAVRYTEAGVRKLADYLVDEGLPLDILDRAAFHYLNPQGNWMSESTLRNIWYDDEMSRSMGDKFRFDGLLYSNNAIFTIVRSWTRHRSHTRGQMEIRGGVIAADLGVFVPGHNNHGLDLLYDPRVERFLDVFNVDQVVIRRDAFYYELPVVVGT